jgi:5'-nucleotidase
VIIGASKPSFFLEGTTLREVDVTTGSLKIGHVTKSFKKGCVYQGGNLDVFETLAGIQVSHPLKHSKQFFEIIFFIQNLISSFLNSVNYGYPFSHISNLMICH